MTRLVPLVLAFLFLPFIVQAQLQGGFKVGLNLSSVKGPVLSENGAKESYENLTGFHVGPVIQLPITESYGVKAEILYNQSGGVHHFEGIGFNIFRAEDGTKILAEGAKKLDLSVLNTYLDVPIVAYFRVGSFQLDGGIRVGLLLSSTADGKMIFSGQTEKGSIIEEYEQTLFYNYKKDKPAGADYNTFTSKLIDNKQTQIPNSIGAYFFDDEEGKHYNSLDFGVSVGASYFINRSLYVGARANFGLSDVTNNKVDFSQIKLDGDELIRQADKDKNFQIQFTIGFSL